MITFKFRMYPTHHQRETLRRHIEICRQLYNRLLEVIKTARAAGTRVSWQETQALLPAWKLHDLS